MESESSIPFIDDDETEKQERNHHRCSLKIAKNQQKKARHVEMSRILHDAEPMNNRSLSPVAPLAQDSENLTSDVSDTEPQQAKNRSAAEFELTIKSNNSVIRIQGFDSKPTITFNAGKASGDVYELVREEVDQTLEKPETEDSGEVGKSGPANAWKLLTKSLINMRSGRTERQRRRGSVERYPKIVLLQEPKALGEIHPKVASANAEKKIDMENAKCSLRTENESIEKSKTKLSRGRQYLNEERRMLKEKKESMEGKKSKLEGNRQRNERFLQKRMDIIEEEKLCVALERQLLGKENAMLNEEMELLHKEREMMRKEGSLLGDEKNETGDEKGKRQNEQQRQEICHDIDDVFENTLKLYPNVRQQEVQKGRTRQENEHQPIEYDDFNYSSAPPLYCQYGPYHCPSVYIPVCNRSIPYCPYSSAEICCGLRPETSATHKNSATQTNVSTHTDAQLQTDPPEEDRNLDLPLGFLSSLFPRIVVMKSFQEEVQGEGAIPKIVEISSPSGNNEKDDEGRCGVSNLGRALDTELNPEPEAVAEGEDETMEEEQKWKEEYGKDSQHAFSTTEEDGTEEVDADADERELTLTSAGLSICEKLTELAAERGKSIAGEKDVEAEDGRGRTGNGTKKSSCFAGESKNGANGFAMRDGSFNFKIYNSVEEREAATGDRKFVTDGKIIVKRSKLWHPSDGVAALTRGTSDKGEITVSVFGNENLVFTVQIRGEGSGRDAKDAKVGTDGFEVAGGNCTWTEGAEKRETSPRTGEALKRLRDRLERGKGKKRELPGGEFEFPGLFLVKPSNPGRGFPGDDYIMTKDRVRRNRGNPVSTREYYCEECLATMRLFEDENPSVKNMVDKFETIIQLGSY